MISIIVAVAEDGVIGNKNSLLWNISEDMHYFRRVTTGHAVIMGRKTYESIGRPLPKRHNIVVSRDAALVVDGCTVVGSLQEALELCKDDSEPYIIGGGEIYRQAMDFADRLYITKVHNRYEGDTYFPEIKPEVWKQIASTVSLCGKEFPHPFTFEIYDRQR